jgi:hypothetical protein
LVQTSGDPVKKYWLGTPRICIRDADIALWEIGFPYGTYPNRERLRLSFQSVVGKLKEFSFADNTSSEGSIHLRTWVYERDALDDMLILLELPPMPTVLTFYKTKLR